MPTHPDTPDTPGRPRGGRGVPVTATEDGLVAGHAAPGPPRLERNGAPATEAEVRDEIETDLLTDLMEECP